MSQRDLPKDIAKYTTDEGFLRASREFSERMKTYPRDIGVAMGVTMVNLAIGCPWGITTSANREFMDAMPEMMRSSDVDVYRLAKSRGVGGETKYIVLVNLKKMLGILDREARGLITGQEIQAALRRHDESVTRLNKFLAEGRQGDIAIFILIKSTDIIADGRRYPAFAVTLSELIYACMIHGYSFVFGKEKVSPNALGNKLEKVYQNLVVAPSENGIFVKIAR